MDDRLYFIAGDLFSNIVMGVVAGLISWLAVDGDWNMWFAMFVMMGLGMVAALVLWFPLGIYFGAMEVMVPLMLSGMLSGMVVGMWCAMSPLTFTLAAVIGGACGLAGIVAVWVMNNQLRGITSAGDNHGR